MSLYDLSQAYQNILELFEQDEFKDNGEIKNALAKIEEEFSQKAANVVRLIKNRQAEADAISAEIKRLESRKKSRENAVKSLKNYLMENMVEPKLKTDLFSLYVGSSQSVELEISAENLPLDFQKVKIEADKTKLKEALKTGEIIDGVSLVDKPFLTIR